MLTVDVKVGGRLIAEISAQNLGPIPGTHDTPGDFVGEEHQQRRYDVRVTWHDEGDASHGRGLLVGHDRFYGWEGLLHTITARLMPVSVETISVDDEELLAARARARVKMADTEAGPGNCG